MPKHKVYFDGVAAFRGQGGWRCKCGHVYPVPPKNILEEIQTTGKSQILYKWLDPLIEKHEQP